MEYTIKSRKLFTELTFSRPGSAYIYVDLNGESGTLGLQPCDGGKFRGSTLEYKGDDQRRFESICRKWYRSYIKNLE